MGEKLTVSHVYIGADIQFVELSNGDILEGVMDVEFPKEHMMANLDGKVAYGAVRLTLSLSAGDKK